MNFTPLILLSFFMQKLYVKNISFIFHLELEPLFNWNVKQLFLYLSAEYETEQNVTNFF